MNKETLIALLIGAKICRGSEIKGASPQQIGVLETAIGRKLPAQYREFLLAIGCAAGGFFQGTDIFLCALDGMQDAALALLQENHEAIKLADDVFIFSMHQGYEFTYFKTSDGDDPPVYQYVEGNGPPVLTWHSFTDFLRDSIARHASLRPAADTD